MGGMSRQRFVLEEMAPGELVPNPANFRRHPDSQKVALQASVDEHGWVDAPLWNKRTRNLIDGHARVELALANGEALIPVKVVEMPLAQERRLLRSFDAIGAMAEVDDEALASLIESIDDAALEQLLGEVNEPASGLLPEADPDALPERVETRCKAGELWQLGEHRLLCGDATKREDVERLMGGKRLSLVWTDPPYGVRYAEKNEFLNAIAHGNRNQTPIEGDDGDEAWTEDLVRDALSLACEYGLAGAAVYVACPPGTPLPHFIAAVAKSGFQFRHSLAWVKNQFVLGRCDYHYRHEIILYGWKDGAHFFRDNHSQDSVFEVDKPRASAEHPVMKPVELIRAMVENSSRPAEIVYDPFLGSGSTLIACEELGRSCYGCEIEPRYCGVCLARWEQSTGREATRL